MSNIITIPVSRISDFKKLATRFQNKQKTYNMPIGSYTYGNITINDDGFITIEITLENFAEVIRKDDADEYSFCGIITKEDGIVKTYIENNAYLPYFKDFPKICDHCGTNRPRNTYYVFEKGESQVNIGSTCVKDYFGINAVESLAFCEKLLKLRTSFQKDDRVLTFSQVAAYINDHISEKWNDLKVNIPIDDLFTNGYRHDNTPCLLDYCRHHYSTLNDDFQLNCFNALKLDYTTVKNWRIYFCAVYFALKAKQYAPKSLSLVTSPYKTGDRITADVKVIFTKKVFFNYGYNSSSTSLFIKMLNTATNEILTTCNSGNLYNVQVGDTFTIIGTVKGISDYKGNKSWDLTRCKKA